MVMRIDSECLEGTKIPIDGMTFKSQHDLNNFIKRIDIQYPNLTSKQWRAILYIAFDALAIGFTDNKEDDE